MATNNAANIATGATSTVLTGQGVGTAPTFSAAPTLTSVTFGSGTALSVYQEGTWTPTITGGSTAGTTTYGLQVGQYTKIGNIVIVGAYIAISAATGTGTLVIGGLPFTVKNVNSYYPATGVFWQGTASWTWPVGATSLSCIGVFNSTNANIWAAGTAISGNFMQMANSTLALSFSLAYQV